MLQEKIIDAQTGEVTFRDYTAEELAYAAQKEQERLDRLAAIEAAQKAKEAVLEKLGLSADEVAALLS